MAELTVVTTNRLRPELRELILKTAPVTLVGPEGWEEALGRADVALAFRLQRHHVEAAPNLKWVQILSAGAEHLPLRELADRGVLITNVAGIHTATMSEHALMLMLALARNFPLAYRQQQDQVWEQRPFAHMPTLAGKTALIVGLGTIGSALAKRLLAMEMAVLAVGRTARHDPVVGDVVAMSDMGPLLARADYVILMTALTSETRGMMDARRFAQMKPGAVLINLARGGVVVEAALMEALSRGQVGAAGLDVVETEPLPVGHPLWTMPNVIVTPHVGGRQENYMGRVVAVFTENLRRFMAQQPLQNLVDPDRGY